MPFTPPDPADKAKLMTLGADLLEAWRAGTSDEWYDMPAREWKWNTTEASGVDYPDWRIVGPAALAATLYRFEPPTDPGRRRNLRHYARDAVDRWFEGWQDPVTGGMFRTSAANVADEGLATFMGFTNLALVVACLEEEDRWAEQILAALDYSNSRNEKTWYPNGNIQIYKLIAYQLGARVSGNDAARVQDVEDLWDFTYTPTGADPLRWRGCGYFVASAGPPEAGYFSEVVSTNPSTDHSSSNVFDAIYTSTQANLGMIGYLISEDERFATVALTCETTMLDYIDRDLNRITHTDGSRHPGAHTGPNFSPAALFGAWWRGRSDFAAVVDSTINAAADGIDAEFREFLSTTNPTIYRHAGMTVAAAIIAAHGRPL